MRIFCAIEKEPFPGNRLWHNNIIDALVDLGHDVVLFDFPLDPFYVHANTFVTENARWIADHRPHLEAELLGQIGTAHRKKPIHVFLSYFYSAHASSDTIQKIRALGIKTVNWYCNASYQFELVRDIAPAFDLSLVPEHFRLGDYRAVGARPLYCQEAANPRFYRSLDLPRDLDIVFIGQNYASREEYCASIHAAGLNVDVWGNGWGSRWSPTTRGAARFAKRIAMRLTGARQLPISRYHGFCTDEEMVRIYNRAKIALGFGVVWTKDYKTRPIYQVRLRDFEAPMCGTFYLSEHQPELGEFFDIGKEIETFRSVEELLDKSRFYLRNDAAREKIATAGQQRCRKDHTWQKRLSNALVALQ